jgi:replication-associated recombination protein RarA
MNRKPNNAGWLDKYRPASLAACVLPQDRIDFFQPFTGNDRFPNLLFHGGFGIGKTTIAKIIAEKAGSQADLSWNEFHQYIRLDNVSNMEYMNNLIGRMTVTTIWSRQTQIWVLDEVDKLQARYQSRLLGVLEQETHRNAFILIANGLHKIEPAIKNRCSIVQMDIEDNNKAEMVAGLTRMGARILTAEEIYYDTRVVEDLAEKNWACPRSFITDLELFSQGGKLKPL